MSETNTPRWDCPIDLVATLRDGADPVFGAPWEATAFAMTLALHERGLFTWAEWVAYLSGSIREAQAAGVADREDSYYERWLTALERIVTEKGVFSVDALLQRRAAWDEAARRTSHGMPIELG